MFPPIADGEEANEVTASPTGRSVEELVAHYPGDSIAYQAQSLLLHNTIGEGNHSAHYITNV
jgi:hypothetical protein